jgi:ATP-dependent DNA helicase RecQ
MQGKALEILEKYWGYTEFRPLQDDIIQAVLEGKDTLALLPTGGGKSICFQVPALCLGGLCLVVSPLIALMQDQVEQLQKRGIRAAMINSSISAEDIGLIMERCALGEYSFLYVSPERLQSETFLRMATELPVRLIAIDESHCVSQWGHDFRPAYLQIAPIRNYFDKNVPVIALTASATVKVCDDIEKYLGLKHPQKFSKSFERKELCYVVRHTEDKLNRILAILDKVAGSSILYVRNRKKTHEISEWLNLQGIPSSPYHAGLDYITRELRQKAWIEGSTRVMVSTNAFGMGIDKADVRTVIHLDIPESPEAYYQEAGRAGRDGNKSYAVLLVDHQDFEQSEKRFAVQFPSYDETCGIYTMLCNYLQLPVGGGGEMSFTFDTSAFAERYRLNAITVFNAMRFLEREGLITFQAHPDHRARIKVTLHREELYEFEVMHPAMEHLIRTLLRMYPGILNEPIVFRELELAEKAGMTESEIKKKLNLLHQKGVVSYSPARQVPLIYFALPRQHPDRIPISKSGYSKHIEEARKRFKTMQHFAQQNESCRSTFLLDYFNEKNTEPCGQCDICLAQKPVNLEKKLLEALKNGPLAMPDLLAMPDAPHDTWIELIRNLSDNGSIRLDSHGLIHLNAYN